MDRTNLPYLAGFFDGEGSVTIHINGTKKSPRGFSPNHTLQVSIGNTDKIVLDQIFSVYGGSLQKRKVYNKNHRQMYQWTIRCGGALRFLGDILPYLRMKRKQVEIGINFQKTKGYRRDQLKPEHILWREEQRILIRGLNGRNPDVIKI